MGPRTWQAVDIQPKQLSCSLHPQHPLAHISSTPTPRLANLRSLGLLGKSSELSAAPLSSPGSSHSQYHGLRLTDVFPIHVVEERDTVELGAGIVQGTHQPGSVPQLPGPGCLNEHVIACSEKEGGVLATWLLSHPASVQLTSSLPGL